MTRIIQADSQGIAAAAALVKKGGLVVFPTETVYGLGANALDGRAVARIFEAKDRPHFNPLIVHVADLEAAAALVGMDARARKLAAAFWPGALTMILPRRADCPVSDLCSAGLPTLAVRVPRHKIARQLLQAAGVPVAAPSANRSGLLSPTTPAHAMQSLQGRVDMVLAGGACDVGLESTVIDLSGRDPVLARPGSITPEMLADVLGMDIVTGQTLQDGEQPSSPGQLLRHYAPSVPVRLEAVDLLPGEALLAFGSIRFMGVRGGGAAKDLPEGMIRNLSPEGDLYEAAANLFAMLHDLDQPGHSAIAVMAIPGHGVGMAINDRLQRAAKR